MHRYLFPLLILTGIVLASCNQNNAAPPRDQTNHNIQVEQSSYEENQNLNNQEIASHLATLQRKYLMLKTLLQ